MSTLRHQRTAGYVLLLVAAALLGGCGTVQHAADLDDAYVAPAGARVKLGDVTNATGKEFDVDVEQMLAAALNEALHDKGLLATSAEGPVLQLDVRIEEYAKGDAFGRWLMPGVGSTVLEIHCEVKDGGKVVGGADARRTVDAGGLYTVGAWRTIFAQVAKDVVEDLSGQLGEAA